MISFFTNDPELLEFGSYALLSWFLLLPVIGFQIICSNFFQAIGRSKSAMFLTLTRQLIFLIPAVIIFPRLWGVKGLLHAAPFADLLSVLLTGIWFYYGIKNLGKDPVKKVSSDLIPDAEAMLSVDKAAINSRHKD
jgi:Na+-driven multidrug efflux pump